MKKVQNNLYFIILIIFFINSTITIVFGTYLESYESFFSSFICGEYYNSVKVWWQTNNHFLLLYIYESLSNHFEGYNFYGLFSLLYNWMSLTLFGVILYKFIFLFSKRKPFTLFIFIYFIISIENIINLNSTRITIFLSSSIYLIIWYNTIIKTAINSRTWFIIYILITFSYLIRIEITLIVSLVFSVIFFIYKKNRLLNTVPLLIGIILFSINFYIQINYLNESQKIFVTKEKIIFDQNNFNYAKLTPLQKLEIEAIREHGIVDEVHFTNKFYDAISMSHQSNGLFSIFNGLNINAIINSFKNSLSEFANSWHYILYFMLIAIYLISSTKGRDTQLNLSILFIFFFPLLLCIFGIVPSRFLTSYYVIFGTILFFLTSQYSLKYSNTYILKYSLISLMLLIIVNSYKENKEYLLKDLEYKIFSKKLIYLSANKDVVKPIVIINIPHCYNVFSVKPFDRIPKQKSRFLSISLLTAWDFQAQSWIDICNCNPLSIKQKIDYIVFNKNGFISDENSLSFLKKYFKFKYHKNLVSKEIISINDCVAMYEISYENYDNQKYAQ